VKPCKTLKKGKLLCASFATNLFNAAMWPANFCTSFLSLRWLHLGNPFILSGLASMPLVATRHTNTLPCVTPKTHFSGLSLSLATRILAKVYVRSVMYEALFLLATTMSSTYESTFLSTWSFNAAFVILQNVEPALCSPSSILI
jgi:hypothetical protein